MEFFEKKIRPLLVEHCYKCHGSEADKPKGKLLLDSAEGLLKGGESGPAITPGAPEKSRLIKAVSYTDKDLQMPPQNKRLSGRQISDLSLWIKMGAPWPAEHNGNMSPTRKAKFAITDEDRTYWAFQPVRRRVPPRVKHTDWIKNPIDAFILSELESKGLVPNPPATKRALVRRVYFDLIGLPPAPEEVTAFEKDRSPAAYEGLIDQLLSRPQYGERWARHWLDVVRYAQSNGYERDGEKPFAWRYRDYVIKSFNEDKPYDRFVLEEIAGDELPDATTDSIIATGFQRLGVWDDEPDDKRMAEFDELDDILSTTASSFLGLTLGCARCHDHKFDPISQADYYQSLSFFRNLRPYENAKYTLDSANFVPLAPPGKVNQWREGWQEKIKALEARLRSAQDAEKKSLEEELARVKEEKPPFEPALAVRERGGQSEPTHILARGNPRAPGVEVQPAFLAVLGGQKPALRKPGPTTLSSGRRLAFAEWLTSPQNPLTARVMVNRLWQHHFGKGLVPTTTDFGRAGLPPSHPKLLDWLAAEFVDSPTPWSLKKMHKLILMSNSYRMSSRSDNPRAEKADPGNDLLWRQNLRRLEAEALRDSILRISGQLNSKMGGRGFFPHLDAEVLAGQSRPGLDWEKSSPDEQSRRSIYAFIRRTMQVPLFENFDYSNTTSPLGERPVTTVAPQALMFLNDDFIQRQAQALAERLRREAGDNMENQTRRGYQLAFGRAPSKAEARLSLAFLKRQALAASDLSTRLTFRPDVANSLAVEYLKQLAPEDLLRGPRQGWDYYRGRWSPAYEGIRTVDRQRGPFALWAGQSVSNCVIEVTLVLDRATEFASLLLRSSAQGDEQRGYEVLFDPRQQRIAFRKHGNELAMLAQAPALIPSQEPFQVKVELAGAHLQVWLSGSGSLDATDTSPVTGSGFCGVRTWGAALNMENLVLSTEGKRIEIKQTIDPSNDCVKVKDAKAASCGHAAEQRALESFCLLLFNLNEFVYVD